MHCWNMPHSNRILVNKNMESGVLTHCNGPRILGKNLNYSLAFYFIRH